MKTKIGMGIFILVIVSLILMPLTSYSGEKSEKVKIMYFFNKHSILHKNLKIVTAEDMSKGIKHNIDNIRKGRYNEIDVFNCGKYNTTTINELLDEGWELKQIAPITSNEGYLYFIKR